MLYKNFVFKISFILLLLLSTSCAKKIIEDKPVRKNITETVFASGVLVPDNQYNLTSLSDGYIIKLDFEEGDMVKKGNLLAVIENEQSNINAKSSKQLLSIATSNASSNSPALKQINTNIEMAKQKIKQDERQVERYKNLFEVNSIPKLEYENSLLALENSKTNLASLQENYLLIKQQADQQLIIQKSQSELSDSVENNNKIIAVIDGKVYKKKKQLGDLAKKGDVIAVIGNPNKIYALLSVDESNISKIKLKQKVIIQLNTNKTKTYNGVVSQIYPAFDEQTQSFYCKIEFIDKLDFKISGTQLQGNIIIGNRKNVLVIPQNFLNYGNKVKVKDIGEIKVETGFISNDFVEIKKGLNENSIILAEKIK